MGNAKLKSQGAAMLRDSKEREAYYIKAMRKTESQMTPVLRSLQDQVIFLKRNLRARAMGSLKGTSSQISAGLTAVMKSIDNSMQEADKPIDSLSASDNEGK